MSMTNEHGYLLLVEDDPDILMLLETTLSFNEYHVVTAPNGREALEIAQKEHPRMVIADIMMPHVDGYGLVHRLKINPETRHIPVVFITATYVTPEDRDYALQIGVARILKKPVDLQSFLETVKELLDDETRTATEPFDEFAFYDAYRQLLETKLDQKTKQIAREERLLGVRVAGDDQDLQDSHRHAIRESNEIKLLLDEIQKQLDRLSRMR